MATTSNPAPILYHLSGGVAVITINRPKVLGSIDPATIAVLREALRRASSDDAVRCVLLTGSGRGFCAGAQLGGSKSKSYGKGAQAMSVGDGVSMSMIEHYNPLVMELKTLPKPLVVAVNGVAAGGGVGVALSGDVVLAAASARFELVFAPKLGLAPDLGGAWFMARAIGRAKTLGLAMTGDRLGAAEAEKLGLVYRVYPDAELQEQAMLVAAKIAEGPTLAFLATRRVVDQSTLLNFQDQLELERKEQKSLGDSPDFAIAMRAFMKGSKPKFTGKL